MKPDPNKPPYRVPTMAEIAAVPPNGFTVASTFSGCGGSCLGYRMAGFRVVWANEFVPAAAEVYRLNHPGTALDTRDIRSVTPEDIFRDGGVGPGRLDVLDGSPPCASFSTAGKRASGWGVVRPYSDTAQRCDDLFFEFARLLKGVRPRAFIAENVSGLVKGVAKGYFLEVLAALKGCGYLVEARLLDAQWLGVPQMRQRLIFCGVRSDLARDGGVRPAFPVPLSYRYSVRDALPHVVRQGDNAGFGGGSMRPASRPSPTIGTGPQTGNGRFPPSAIEAIEQANGFNGHGYDSADEPMRTVQAARPVNDVHRPGGEPACGWDAADRRARGVDPGSPVPTVLQHGRGWNQIALQGPVERRKFTIAELKRVCGFPDDFLLTGSYAQQWERLGRAVPPVMMRYIAKALTEGVLCRLK